MAAHRTYNYSDEEIDNILVDIFKKHPRTSLNNITTTTRIPAKVLKARCDSLCERGILMSEGTNTGIRYLPKGEDRRTINPDADKPLLGHGSSRKKGNVPKFAPSPASDIGKALLSKQKGIPADLKAFTPIDEEPKVAPAPKADPMRDAIRNPAPAPKASEPAVAKPAPAPTPETVPEPSVTPMTHAPEDIGSIDVILDQLKQLKGMTRGTFMDAQIDLMIQQAEGSLSSCLRPCPHCGGRARINTVGETHSILCECGTAFAYARNNKDLACTVKAWNRRADDPAPVGAHDKAEATA